MQKKKGYFTTGDVIKETKLEKSGINKNLKIIKGKGREYIKGYIGNSHCYTIK